MALASALSRSSRLSGVRWAAEGPVRRAAPLRCREALGAPPLQQRCEKQFRRTPCSRHQPLFPPSRSPAAAPHLARRSRPRPAARSCRRPPRRASRRRPRCSSWSRRGRTSTCARPRSLPPATSTAQSTVIVLYAQHKNAGHQLHAAHALISRWLPAGHPAHSSHCNNSHLKPPRSPSDVFHGRRHGAQPKLCAAGQGGVP